MGANGCCCDSLGSSGALRRRGGIGVILAPQVTIRLTRTPPVAYTDERMTPIKTRWTTTSRDETSSRSTTPAVVDPKPAPATRPPTVVEPPRRSNARAEYVAREEAKKPRDRLPSKKRNGVVRAVHVPHELNARIEKLNASCGRDLNISRWLCSLAEQDLTRRGY